MVHNLVQWIAPLTKGLTLLSFLLSITAEASWHRFQHGAHWYKSPSGKRIRQQWMSRCCEILNIEFNQYLAPRHTKLVVANHISWLDIIVLGAIIPCDFVAKSEVRKWPLVGYLSSLMGTLYLPRSSARDSFDAIQAIQNRLDEDHSVTIFPEGTTTTGIALEPFRSLLFESVLAEQHIIQPVAIYYADNMQDDCRVPFTGSQGFLPHLLRLLRLRSIKVDISFCEPVYVTCLDDRKRLAAESQRRIDLALKQSDNRHSRAIGNQLNWGAEFEYNC